MVPEFRIKYFFAGEHVHCRVIATRDGKHTTLDAKFRVQKNDFGYMQLAMRGVIFEEDEPPRLSAVAKPKHGPTVMPAPKQRLLGDTDLNPLPAHKLRLMGRDEP